MPTADPRTDQSQSGQGRVRVLRAGYISPRWLYVLEDISRIVTWTIFGALAYACLWLTVFENPFRLPMTQQTVVTVAGMGFAWIAAGAINHVLLGWRGGYGLRPYGSDRLTGSFAPGRISLRIGRRDVAFDATTPHQFMMREHPDRMEEARAEERARSLGLEQQPGHFRRAFEIVLDLGLTRHRLAEVATEEQARDLIRQLQELDGYARGSAGAGTLIRNDRQTGAAPMRRPSLVD